MRAGTVLGALRKIGHQRAAVSLIETTRANATTMATHVFQQVDVFTAVPFKGNPLAVVVDGNDLAEQQMAAIASWTNLSETTFLVAPTEPTADYRVRIFTPEGELPFAGHPTLGSCHAWLKAGNSPKGARVVQECGVGLVRIKRDGHSVAFAGSTPAPQRQRRSGSACPAGARAPGRARSHQGLAVGRPG